VVGVRVLLIATVPAMSASRERQFVVVDEHLYRSTDAGSSWVRIKIVTGKVSVLSFVNATVGHAVTNGGRTIWTTHDAGRAWHLFEFS
jgi:photosystem II stability/assembly factor-like uncharacterized protein